MRLDADGDVGNCAPELPSRLIFEKDLTRLREEEAESRAYRADPSARNSRVVENSR